VCRIAFCVGWATLSSVTVFSCARSAPQGADSYASTRAALAEWDAEWSLTPRSGLQAPDIAVPCLARIASSEADPLRQRALYALAAFGSRARSAVATIQQGTADRDTEVRCVAAYALAYVAPDTSGAAVALLTSLLTAEPLSPQSLYLTRAARETRASLSEQYAAILLGGPRHLRTAAFTELVLLGGQSAQKALHLLRTNIGDTGEGAVLTAVLLGASGIAVPEGPALLAAGLRHPDQCVRREALCATRRLQVRTDAVLESLLACLEDVTADDLAVADTAADAASLLSEWPDHGERVVPCLVTLVGRSDLLPFLRATAAHSLSRFPEYAALSVPVLVRALYETRRIRLFSITGPPHQPRWNGIDVRGHPRAPNPLGELGAAARVSAPARIQHIS
jgi:hypothetical protein